MYIHHIAIIVSDYEAAKDFYVNKLGFSVVRENYRPERKDWKLDLSWEGCGRGRKQLKCCRVVMMNSISGSVSLLFKDTGSRRYLDCRFPIRSRPGGMGN